MKKIVLSFMLLFVIGTAHAGTAKSQSSMCKNNNFDSQQINILKKSFMYGKPFDLGYTLAAIAWQESIAGKYLINVNDPSFGVYHILISSAANRSNIKGLEVNRLAMALIRDQRLSASFAIKELLFWQGVLKPKDKDWSNVWAAYNGGYNYKSSQAQTYSKNISRKIKWLKTCLIRKSKHSTQS